MLAPCRQEAENPVDVQVASGEDVCVRVYIICVVEGEIKQQTINNAVGRTGG